LAAFFFDFMKCAQVIFSPSGPNSLSYFFVLPVQFSPPLAWLMLCYGFQGVRSPWMYRSPFRVMSPPPKRQVDLATGPVCETFGPQSPGILFSSRSSRSSKQLPPLVCFFPIFQPAVNYGPSWYFSTPSRPSAYLA